MDLSFAVYLFKVLGDSTRLRIVKLLCIRECCVCELSGITGLSNSTISEHLKKLKKAGLVNERKQSYWSYYALKKNNQGSHGNKILKIISLIEDEKFMNDYEKLLSGANTCSGTVNNSKPC